MLMPFEKVQCKQHFYEASPTSLACHAHSFICTFSEISTVGQNARHNCLALGSWLFHKRNQMDWSRSHTWPPQTCTLNNSLPYCIQSFEAFINFRNLLSQTTLHIQPRADLSCIKVINTANKMSITSSCLSLQDIFFTDICTLRLSFCSCCHFCYQNLLIFEIKSFNFCCPFY